MKKHLFNSLPIKRTRFLFLIIALVYTSCSRMEDDSPANIHGTGHLKLFITDDPVQWQDIAEVNVTIEKVVLKKAESGDDHEDDTTMHNENRNWHSGNYRLRGDHEDGEDSAFFVVLLDTPLVVNLLELRNGVTLLLAELNIPAGLYSQVRLFISNATLKLESGAEFELDIPSALSSGLKIMIRPALVIEEGMSEELLLDIDLSRSLVVIGSFANPLGFKFRPVIRSACNSSSGRIEGFVTDMSGNAVSGAAVWLEEDSVISSTITKESGFYKMIGISEGNYTLYAVIEDYDTARVENIRITRSGMIKVDIHLTPVSLNGIFMEPGPEKLLNSNSREMIAADFPWVITKSRRITAAR